MNNAVEDIDLFIRSTIDAYIELCKRAFPPMDSDAESSDFTHFVSAESLSDDEHNVFLVELAEQAKLIYGFDQDSSSIYEVVLRRGEFQEAVRAAIEKFGA
jgi:hypothetical protein